MGSTANATSEEPRPISPKLTASLQESPANAQQRFSPAPRGSLPEGTMD